MTLGMLLFSGFIFAQSIKPQLEAEGNLVKTTYLHENGKISQEGYYKKGKLHGKWISYDANGNKIAIGEYRNGAKVGKWFFWTDKSLSEVEYSDSKIAFVKNWQQEAIVGRN